MRDKTNKKPHWKVGELRAILRILKKHGHADTEKFIEFLPNRTPTSIKNFLQRIKSSTRRKFGIFCNQELYQIHSWLPYIYSQHRHDHKISRNLLSFSLFPFREFYSSKYGNNTHIYDGVDFRLAYQALFNSLNCEKFPANMNKETAIMINTSLQQLCRKVGPLSSPQKQILKNNLLEMKSGRDIESVEATNTIMSFAELNILNWSSHDMEVMCRPE